MRRTLPLLVVVLALLPAGRAAAGTAEGVNETIGSITINYVYAAQLGFGGYDVGGVSAAIYTLPLGYTFEDLPREDWKLRVTLPLQYGNYQFQTHLRDAERTKVTINANTLGLVPGLELQIPLAERWRVRPFGNLGLATAFEPDSLAYVWAVGAHSLVERSWHGVTFGLGNGLVGAGNADVNGGDSVVYGTLENGVAVSHPLGFGVSGVDETVRPTGTLFFIWYYFFPDMKFDRAYKDPLEVENQFEFGLALGDFIPLSIFDLDTQHVGVSLRFGQFQAFHLNLGFPF